MIQQDLTTVTLSSSSHLKGNNTSTESLLAPLVNLH